MSPTGSSKHEFVLTGRRFAIKPGQKYGRLVVQKGGPTRSKIRCLCECGNTVHVRGDGLRSGNTQSCGCLKAEADRVRAVKHGLSTGSERELYLIWAAIKDRCYNPNNKRYEHYGNRGIKMQESWLHDPLRFVTYIRGLPNFGVRKELNLTLDRIDNDDGYREGNLRWATHTVQALNKQGKA